MEEKKKNISSGAEKVENITKEKKAQKSATENAVKAEKAHAKKRVAEARKEVAEKKQKSEDKLALKKQKLEKKAELKKRRLEAREKRAEAREKRRTARMEARARHKEARAERKAKWLAHIAELKNETKAERSRRLEREKKAKIALKAKQKEERRRRIAERNAQRAAARADRLADKMHRREQRTERKRSGGNGGWLAAVISLGTVCLVLSGIVTAGVVRYNDVSLSAELGMQETLFEMVSASENLDGALDKLRISGGANEQRKLLTDILIDTAMMEVTLERIPVDTVTATDISAFVNTTNEKAREMLAHLAEGKKLSLEEKEEIARLYETNSKLYGELNGLVLSLEKQAVTDFLSGKGGLMDALQQMGKSLEEVGEKVVSTQKTNGAKRERISSSEAEKRVWKYFEGYHVSTVSYTGETTHDGTALYNFILKDEDGLETFAEIDGNGRLVMFDSYKACTDKNFDMDACDAVARAFLHKMGVDNVEATWRSDGGMTANITYVPTVGGVRAYPARILVRVCESRGVVVGMDAHAYYAHEKFTVGNAKLSLSEAKACLSDGLEVEDSHLCLYGENGKDVLCYEFTCKYGEEKFVVYVDAQTGDEVDVKNVRGSKQGDYLR